MHQIIEQQKVVNEHKNRTMEGRDVFPLESNPHKNDLVIISQIINMIETEGFWHHKTSEHVDRRNSQIGQCNPVLYK